MVPDASELPERRSLQREVLIASIGILAFLGALKHASVLPVVGQHAFAVAAAGQLYVPLFLIGRRGIDRASLGLDLRDWKRDLVLALLLGIATIAPFAVGHHVWQTGLFHRRLAPRLPDDLALLVLTQVLAVALPEELFFRGYLQRRMELIWPASRRIFGAPFGRAILSASVVFALAHFVGEYRIDRLGPFFPALLFGLLRTRTNGILAPVVYHAFCNILSDILWASYRS